MLGRIYTFIFTLVIVSALFYQRSYLSRSTEEFNAQLMAENVVLPIITANNYTSYSFADGGLKSSFAGKNFVYYSNKHFDASDDLIYKQFSHAVKTRDASQEDDMLIQTTKAQGEIVSPQSENSQAFSSKNQLKYVILPNMVHFDLNKNIGKTSDVFIDAINKTLQTNNPIESTGPTGHTKGIGFFYDIDQGEFKIKSDVEGDFLPSQISKG